MKKYHKQRIQMFIKVPPKTIRPRLPAFAVSMLLMLGSVLLALAQELPPENEILLVTNPPLVATFFLVQNRLGPPFPFDPFFGILPVYQWKPGVFLVDDSQVDYGALNGFSSGGFMSLMSGPSPCDPCSTNGLGGDPGGSLNWGYTNHTSSDLWLEMVGATDGTATLVIHRPTPATLDVYDLIYTTNLNPTTIWSWITNIPPNVSGVTVGTTNPPLRFFRLKKVTDLDGDGLRDDWEWGGTPPVAIDDDRDNDGIPDSIEASSGSLTNDPTSLPPPSLYVNNNAAAGGDGSFDLPLRDIQTAINLATNYSVILVKSGTYSGVSNRNLTFDGKKLALISEKGWEETRIDCSNAANSAFIFNSPTQDYHLQIIGFTITNAGAPAISCSGTSAPTFVNCRFIANTGGAVACTNASPVFVNCQFITNSSTGNGGAIYATGAGSAVRVTHSSLRDNTRANNGGQVYATGSATITLNNTIVWGVRTNLGIEIMTSGGTVTATYCDIRGGYSGTGNFSSDPIFEPATNGAARLAVNSPCIDQGVVDGLPGFGLFTTYDMDGERRLDQAGTLNTYSIVDIGADEYVYRLQFPLDVNGYSIVDEASGAAFLGTNSIGPIIAIVDDEDRESFHIFQLDSEASAVVASFANSITNSAYAADDDKENQVTDMEGLTFDSATTNLYVITSQTKRNRYRNVDNIDTDPVNDPPSNDYDRRRSVLMRLRLDSTLTNVASRTYWESESNRHPGAVSYDATNGMIALIRQRLATNSALSDKAITNKVLIARNTANKFGKPVNGVAYANGASLPYTTGGPTNAAGVSLGEFAGTSGLLTNSGVASNTIYFYKVWAIDANTNYTAGIVSSNKSDGMPKLYINEFMAQGDGDDWIEIYNPAHVPVNMNGLWMSDGFGNAPVQITNAANIPRRGYFRFFANGQTTTSTNLKFKLDGGGENILLSMDQGQTQLLDGYNFGSQTNNNNGTEGRAWDAGPRGFVSYFANCAGAKYKTNSSFPPTSLATGGFAGPATNNHPQSFKHFLATPDVNGTNFYLEWQDVGANPPTWMPSPKQHDGEAINIEDIAFRSTNEMIFGLRAPLSNRTNGNAYYFIATNFAAFLPTGGWTNGAANGLAGPYEMNLAGLGFRSIKWCPHGLTNSTGQEVQRYLVLAGASNGGSLQREKTRQKFTLYSWDGNPSHGPNVLIDDLYGYAIRPEGVELISVNGAWRVMFAEDRFTATGYGTRNVIHWPISILGNVP